MIYLIPAAGVLALAFAAFKANWVKGQDAGDEKMRTIAGHIQEGAMAFLNREYRVLSVFVIVVAVLLLSDRPLRLASVHSQAIFTLIILAYTCSLLYAALWRFVRFKEQFYAVQVGVDIVLVSVLMPAIGLWLAASLTKRELPISR